MTDAQFRALIENSEVFKAFGQFKKDIFLKAKVLHRLKDYHHQAEKYGIAYLKQNPNLTTSDVALIESIL